MSWIDTKIGWKMELSQFRSRKELHFSDSNQSKVRRGVEAKNYGISTVWVARTQCHHHNCTKRFGHQPNTYKYYLLNKKNKTSLFCSQQRGKISASTNGQIRKIFENESKQIANLSLNSWAVLYATTCDVWNVTDVTMMTYICPKKVETGTRCVLIPTSYSAATVSKKASTTNCSQSYERLEWMHNNKNDDKFKFLRRLRRKMKDCTQLRKISGKAIKTH